MIVVGVVVLGGGALFRRTVIFETYLQESVQGLDIGSPVRYRGVTAQLLGSRLALPPVDLPILVRLQFLPAQEDQLDLLV